MHASLSGADQLKAERLRFVAANTLASADDSEAYCDHSSEDEDASIVRRMAPRHSPVRLLSGGPGVSAEVPVAVSSQHLLACYSHLPEHAAVMAAVKEIMQNNGTVRGQQGSFCGWCMKQCMQALMAFRVMQVRSRERISNYSRCCLWQMVQQRPLQQQSTYNR